MHWPSRITRMRSETVSSSSNSEDTIMTDLPSLASCRTRRRMSVLAPISIPAVGSSSRNSLTSLNSHLAIVTFWALPPLSSLTRISGELALIPKHPDGFPSPLPFALAHGKRVQH